MKKDEDMDEENFNFAGYFGSDTLDAEETIEQFLELWSEGDYDSAYELFTDESDIRAGLSANEWVARREKWAAAAKPAHMRVDVVYDFDREEDGTTTQEVEVFLSLEAKPGSVDTALKELPLGTISYAETGRQWSWARYTVVRANDDDEWRIQSMKDEGATALHLSTAELEEHIENFSANLQTLAQKMGIKDLDSFDADHPNTSSDAPVDDEAFADTDDYLQEVLWIAQRAMHYADALIAQAPQDRIAYDKAAMQATVAQDWERAAAYLDLITKRFSEQKGEVLRSEAIILSRLVEEFDRREMYERADHLTTLVEKALRDSIANDNALEGYLMLADILIVNEARHTEAENVLRQAQLLVTNTKDEANVLSSFGRLAAETGQHEEALRCYQRAAELDSQLGGIWGRIGREQRILLNYAAAEQSLKRSIEQEPEGTSAYADLAFIYTIEHNKLQEARELLELALDMDPESAELMAALAMTYIQSGDLATAQELLSDAELIDPAEIMVMTVRAAFENKRAQRTAKAKNAKARSKSHKPPPKKR
ncbi:MAG: tetratricopeptide repeat protein [Ktedonobacteraceae bacterium]|nr:tetratricopeptide repeat protein [Ktedonobacteraceae bacterium]